MTWTNPIDYLTNQGLTLTIINNKLKVTPAKLVTKEIANFIKQHKDTIKSQWQKASQHVRKLPRLDQLTLQQKQWLEEIAELLQTTPSYLLKHQLIDQFDLVELLDKDPLIVANSICTSPYWLK